LRKDKNLVTILSILPGIFGILGVGYFYIGKKAIGTIFLIAGLIFALEIYYMGGNIVKVVNQIISSFTPGPGVYLQGVFVVIAIYLTLLIISTRLARTACKKYNERFNRNADQNY